MRNSVTNPFILLLGIVLLTTVLFQSGDECHGGISKQINNSLNNEIVTETPIILECKPLLKKDYIDLVII